MSICQRKTKSGKPGGWLVKYKDATTGQWKQRQFKTQSEAEEFDGQAKQAVEMQQALSLRECVVAYIQDHELSESRINLFLRLVNGHNNKKTGAHFTGPAEHLADRYAETLTRQDLESVRSRLRADGIKITTINLYIGILKTVLSWCASEDLIGENPWQKYKSLRGGRTTPRDGTLEDFKAMYPYLPSWMQWASITALALCLRPGVKELFSLKWDAFDWRNDKVCVFMPKVREEKNILAPSWYIALARPRYEEAQTKGAILVCPGPHGCMVTHSRYTLAWTKACTMAGVSMPMYALRHIAASQMHAAGIDVASIAAMLGHKDIKTTFDSYIHALESSKSRAAAALPDLTNMAPNLVSFGEPKGKKTS